MKSRYFRRKLFGISLISEELKSRKLFQVLQSLGIQDCPYQPNLDSLILQYLKFPNSVGLVALYNETMNKYCFDDEFAEISFEERATRVFDELTRMK